MLWWCISNSSVISWMVLLMKWVPWSLIRTLGHPNLMITCSNRKFIIVFALQSFTIVASSHLVSYSFVVIIYLAPDLLVCGLIVPTKSIAHLSNTLRVTWGFRGISSLLDGFPTHWQTSQFWQYSFTSLETVGHHSTMHNIFYAMDFPA